jgi:predicted DNA-binding transcriptional regulator YafY
LHEITVLGYNKNKCSLLVVVKVLRELQRYQAQQQVVELIYLNRSGQISKRAVRIYSVDGERIKAFCYSRRAFRVFTIGNILAVVPLQRRAAGW